MELRKYNLKEHQQLFAHLMEAPIVKSSAAQYPGWKPEEPWHGVYAKYEKLLADKFKAKPYPKAFGKQANYELLVDNDYILFYDSGRAFSTNESIDMGYGVSKKYPNALVLFKNVGETGPEAPIAGYITLENGVVKWNKVSEAESETEPSNPVLDGLQLALDIVGLVPGFGDILDIINAGISFLRGNYLEGFISLIGAIPVVGSVISLPLKALLKGFSKAGDIIKSAYKSGKSADEVWLFIKNSGKLGRKELDMLAKGMGDAADYITKFRKEADALLPDSAAKGLDEFAEFLQRQGDDATEVFSKGAKTSDKATKGILRAKKELDSITGLKRLLGGRILRRISNLFSTALSPKELEALRGAMSMKFFKNMDNPGKLSALVKSTPNIEGKIINSIDDEAYKYFRQLPTNDLDKFMKGWQATYKAGGSSKVLESQLEFLRKNAPDVYAKTKKSIIDAAEAGNNPLYKQFMNNEINGLGSYFSKDYANIISWEGVTARFYNMVPVIYNELKDLGEDVLMTMGIEEQDDVNGLFWPLVKGLLGLTESIPGVGGVVTAGKEMTAGAVKTAGEIPLVGAVVGTAADKLGAGEKATTTYDPTIDYEVVPETDPRLKQQKQAKTKRIQQQKRFF
jgi:hypothetical protein